VISVYEEQWNSLRRIEFDRETSISRQNTAVTASNNAHEMFLKKKRSGKRNVVNSALPSTCIFVFLFRSEQHGDPQVPTFNHPQDAHTNPHRYRKKKKQREREKSIWSIHGRTHGDEHTRAWGPHVRFNRTLN